MRAVRSRRPMSAVPDRTATSAQSRGHVRRKSAGGKAKSRNPKVMPRPRSAMRTQASRSSLKVPTWNPVPEVPAASQSAANKKGQLTPLRAGGSKSRSRSPISLGASKSTTNLHRPTSSTRPKRKLAAGLTYDFRNAVSVGQLPVYAAGQPITLSKSAPMTTLGHVIPADGAGDGEPNHITPRRATTGSSRARLSPTKSGQRLTGAELAAATNSAPGSGATARFYQVQKLTGRQLKSFRSDAVNLEVALQERLRRLESATNATQAGQDIPVSLQVERFRIFSHLFEAIIEKDGTYGSLLRRVKTEYEDSMRAAVNPDLLSSPAYLESIQRVDELEEQVHNLQEANRVLEDENAGIVAGDTEQELVAENRRLKQALMNLQKRCDELEDGNRRADDSGRLQSLPPGIPVTESRNASDTARSSDSDSSLSFGVPPSPPAAPKASLLVPRLRFDLLSGETPTSAATSFVDSASHFSPGVTPFTQTSEHSTTIPKLHLNIGGDAIPQLDMGGVPKLNFGATKATQGYHEEFLAHAKDFSLSWREAMNEMDRTRSSPVVPEPSPPLPPPLSSVEPVEA